MRSKRSLAAASVVAGLVVSGALLAGPAAAAVDPGEPSLSQPLPVFPGFTPRFDAVTVVDARTGEVIGTRHADRAPTFR
ncbi:hypothetical protein [Leifsonia shinshuensis]|uniref:D-alanyl-D-alanine carboxypeptidase n=1 Tax=Leifsonia shinshuensis TaxID=150026 RepID=A0A7G6YDG0_9MICO|nr:hypothetical protein [Leifsonia shinshuensis]QNE36525.1 hypothetical protein F1C12_16340 [Leifsonia shinshuensis]